MKITKRCKYILNDGHKCNKVFSHKPRIAGAASMRKYCDDHVGNIQRNSHLDGHHSLVKSRNVYANVGNNETMQKWVRNKMNTEVQEMEYIHELEKRVSNLESAIEGIFTTQTMVARDVKKEINKPWFRNLIDGIMIKQIRRLSTRIINLESRVGTGIGKDAAFRLHKSEAPERMWDGEEE